MSKLMSVVLLCVLFLVPNPVSAQTLSDDELNFIVGEVIGQTGSSNLTASCEKQHPENATCRCSASGSGADCHCTGNGNSTVCSCTDSGGTMYCYICGNNARNCECSSTAPTNPGGQPCKKTLAVASVNVK